MAVSTSRVLVAVVGVALVVGAVWLYRPKSTPQDVPVVEEPVASAPIPTAVASAPPEPAASAKLDIADKQPLLSAPGLGPAFEELLGRKSMLTFMQMDDFPRRLVATVDNLARGHASVKLWPVNPTPGRFTVDEHDSGVAIAPDNAVRYAPFVSWVETVDTERAVDLYLRMYPLLQTAYEDIGYPNRYFNDRVIEVIDALLAAPDPAGPVKLELLEIKGPVPSERRWVRYQFVDPDLEGLPAGQKILVRVGPDNERRLKAKLRELRQHIVAHRLAR